MGEFLLDFGTHCNVILRPQTFYEKFEKGSSGGGREVLKSSKIVLELAERIDVSPV